MSDEDLIETIVPEADYLGCWGQSFKRIAGAIIVNPNLRPSWAGMPRRRTFFPSSCAASTARRDSSTR